jgi:tetratricopeptide (TPR) repeat protein/HAMP domain-containing protein
LYLSEADYDNQKIAQVTSSKNYILSANYVELSDDIRYIVKKPKDINLFDRKLELMYVAQGEKLDQEIVNESEKTFSASLINENLTKLIKKNPTASVEELKLIAIEEYKKSRKYNNLITDLNLEKFRHYRAAGNHYTFFDMIHGEDRYEIGFSYKEYRVHTHKNALKLFILSIVTTILILVLFPKFFEASLVKPLNSLLRGVHKVNLGNLNVEVHIQVQDEIGFISSSFNSMVASIKQAKQELQDYANTLEDKVQERTKEVQDKMQEVQALKVQQDGDYFLTSLLTKPLFINASKSEVVKTEFLIRQKKRFEFRNKSSELGGDICITGNLKLGTPQKFRRYTMAMNGDAMGKSMQGAGGSLVMGVVMNSIMARSASNKRILDTTPEQWLTDAYHECNSIFKSFNGTMVLSATVALIDDMTGMMHYWNAEHPFTILYRDEKAGFLEESLQLRKLGLESEYEFKVHTFKLMPGDVVLLASDGRDDIDLTPEESFRTINDDEFMILGIVEQAKGNVEHIETILKSKGTITDDLSMLKIIYNATGATLNTDDESIPGAENEKISSISTLPDVSEAYLLGRELYQEGKIVESLEILKSAYSTNDTNSKLNKLLGLICFKSKDYNQAVNVFSKYLTEDNNSEEIWYYLSLAQKRIGSYFTSLESSRKVYELNPSNVNNLVNLSDLYRISGNSLNARIFSEKALIIDKENKNALKILSILEKT